MQMTSQQKYSVVLEELGELLQEKNTTISCQRWQIDELKAKLDAAEKERDEAQAKNVSEKHLLLDSNAIALLREANAQLRECYENITGEIGCVKKLEEVQQTLAFLLPINGGAA